MMIIMMMTMMIMMMMIMNCFLYDTISSSLSLFRTRGVHMTEGRFYKMVVLHVGDIRDSQDLLVSFTIPNGTREDAIPREYLVAYQTGT